MLGTAYLDDSADPSGKVVFLAAGFYCPGVSEWKRLRREWRSVLKPHRVPYYRSYDWRTLTGAFGPLKGKWGEDRARIVADQIRDDLHAVLESSPVLAGFAMGINLSDFREIDSLPEARQNTNWMRECHDYQTAAFRHVFCRITHVICIEVDPSGLVDFVCDDSTHYRKIKRGFDRVRQKFPELGPKMLSLSARNDRTVPELQMADLMADVARDMLQKHIASSGQEVEPSVIKSNVLDVKCWNRKGMLGVLSGEQAGA